MRISDWSSDVCSSDLRRPGVRRHRRAAGAGRASPHRRAWLLARPRALGPRPHDPHRRRVRTLGDGRAVAVSPAGDGAGLQRRLRARSEEHTSELQSLMRTSYAVFCLKKTNTTHTSTIEYTTSLHTNTRMSP